MLRYELPTPYVSRPLPPVDPYRYRQAYVEILSALYHAEAAALEGFSLLEDPAYVESSELFARAARRLVADETKHLQDIADLVSSINGSGIAPPTQEMREFWTAWRSGKVFALPFKPSVAALFCLFSEGLGFAFLYNLAHATSDPDVRRVLLANVEDEKMHLRLSLSILERALKDERGFLTDLAIYVAGYGLLARKAARGQRALLEAVGLDFDVVVGSSLRFVADLIDIVMQRSGRATVAWRALHRSARWLGASPSSIRLLHWSMYLPPPPWAGRAVYLWGRSGRGRFELRSEPAPPAVARDDAEVAA
jgi:hypothetical protein